MKPEEELYLSDDDPNLMPEVDPPTPNEDRFHSPEFDFPTPTEDRFHPPEFDSPTPLEETRSRSHSPEWPRPKKRSHSEALSIYGKCFRIKNNPSKLKDYCPLHKKSLYFGNVVVGDAVHVIRCKFLDDRCYNETNLVVVQVLNRREVVVHLPVECIDVNYPLDYQCFLCDKSNFGSDFDKATKHLVKSHSMDNYRPKDRSYIMHLKEMLLGHHRGQEMNKTRNV